MRFHLSVFWFLELWYIFCWFVCLGWGWGLNSFYWIWLSVVPHRLLKVLLPSMLNGLGTLVKNEFIVSMRLYFCAQLYLLISFFTRLGHCGFVVSFEGWVCDALNFSRLSGYPWSLKLSRWILGSTYQFLAKKKTVGIVTIIALLIHLQVLPSKQIAAHEPAISSLI